MAEQTPHSDAFVAELTSCQSRLYAYILSLTGDREQARDVLQEANLVLWHKAAEFEPGTNFIAWSFRVAAFQVRAHRQKLARDRLVFDDDMLADMADIFAEDEHFDARHDALGECLRQLPDHHRNLIRIRYSDGVSIKTMATQLNRSANAIAKVLHRTRMALMKCIEHKVADGDAR